MMTTGQENELIEPDGKVSRNDRIYASNGYIVYDCRLVRNKMACLEVCENLGTFTNMIDVVFGAACLFN